MQIPFSRAGEAVGGTAFLGTEPGEDDGHTAADGLASGEPAELAGEEQGRLALLLEVGHMRAVQINLCRAPFGGDLQLRQFAAAFENRNPSRDLESLEPFRYVGSDHFRTCDVRLAVREGCDQLFFRVDL